MATARPARVYDGPKSTKTQPRLNRLSSFAPLRTIFVAVCAMGVTGCARYQAQSNLEVRNPPQRVVARAVSVRVHARVRVYSKEHPHAEVRDHRPDPPLLAPQPTPPAFDIARTGNDLLKDCTSTDENSADARHLYCMGIIVGYYEMLTAFKAKCGGDSKKTADQIKDVVVKYLKEHPAEHSEPAAGASAVAIIEAFHCVVRDNN
jgi:hypothetical protein